MNQATYPYPPHARYPADPNQHQMQSHYPPSSHYSPQSNNVSTRSIRPTFVASHPIPASAPYIVHTDDAATKLNDRIRRKCYNCRTTDTSTWRRSSLTPGKVVRTPVSDRVRHRVLMCLLSSATSAASLSARTRGPALSNSRRSAGPWFKAASSRRAAPRHRRAGCRPSRRKCPLRRPTTTTTRRSRR